MRRICRQTGIQTHTYCSSTFFLRKVDEFSVIVVIPIVKITSLQEGSITAFLGLPNTSVLLPNAYQIVSMFCRTNLLAMSDNVLHSFPPNFTKLMFKPHMKQKSIWPFISFVLGYSCCLHVKDIFNLLKRFVYVCSYSLSYYYINSNAVFWNNLICILLLIIVLLSFKMFLTALLHIHNWNSVFSNLMLT